MPAADPLPPLREPARPRPAAAGPEQAASPAPFSDVFSRALKADAPGAATPSRPMDRKGSRGDPPEARRAEPALGASSPHGFGQMSHPTAPAGPAEGSRPAATVPGASAPGPATDATPVLAASGPGGTGPLPDVRAAAVETAGGDGDADGAAVPHAATAPERGGHAPTPPPPAAAPAWPAPVSTGPAPTGAGPVPGNAGSVPGDTPVSAGARSHGASPGVPVPNAGAPGTTAAGVPSLDPSRLPDASAASPEEAPPEAALGATGTASTPRRVAARGTADAWPEEDPAKDTPPATDPVSALPAVVLVPAPPAEPPVSASGGGTRAAGPDGVAATAAAAGGPPVPASAAPLPEAARTTPEPDDASAPEAAAVPGAPDAPPSAAGPDATSPSPPPAAATDSAPPQPVVQPAPAAPSRLAESPGPAGHTTPRPAAEQVASVLVQVAHGPAVGGGQRMVVRLDPAELGKVEIRVEPADGMNAEGRSSVQVALTVDRPETLLLLLRDQPGLHRALDQAGVPAEGRALQFQLAPASPEGAPADRGATTAWGGAADGGRGGGAWHGQGHGGQPGGRHRGHAPADAAGHGAYRAWRDAGLDITA